MDLCMAVLYLNISRLRSGSQSTEACSASMSAVVRKSAIVLLNCSAWELVRGWYGAVVLCSILRRSHMASLSLLQNSLPWSVTTILGTPRSFIQPVHKPCATEAAVLSGMASTLANLVKASVMTRMYFFDASAARRGPKRSACKR